MINRRFFLLLITMFLSTILVACGSKDSTRSDTSEPTYENFEGEGEIQGGIKSDEEIAALAEEEASYNNIDTTEENPANVEMDGHEPETYGSGNFQDYWRGNDNFDLVGYLNDNGYEWVEPHTFFGFPDALKEGEVADFYECRNDDVHKWRLIVEKECGIQVNHKGFDIMYYVHTNKDHQVVVDNTGMTISEDEIIALNTIIEALKVNADSSDPLNGTGLNYEVRQ